MSRNRNDDDDIEDVVPMNTDSDEVNPVEWLEALEASNPQQALKEYQTLSTFRVILRGFDGAS